MRMWMYYDTGEGLEQPYSNLSVKPAIELLTPCIPDKCTLQQSSKQKAEKNRELYTLCIQYN